MAVIPGTDFTKEQLNTDLKFDNVSVWGYSGSIKWSNIGFKYYIMKQYPKAMAWFLLAAGENNSYAQNNIGYLYHGGSGVPKNYLCALKWYLKSAKQNSCKDCFKHIGELFENGQGVSLDKNRALEWYCRSNDSADKSRLKALGFHRSREDKDKPVEQLIYETEIILEAEKKNLEEKVHKTQEEIETLEQLEITYKLVNGKMNSWDDIPILVSEDNQYDIYSMNGSTVNFENDIPGLKNQIQLLEQEKFQLEDQIQEKDKKISSLESENQELQVKNSHFKSQVKEKDNNINSAQTENTSLNKGKDNTYSSLETEKRTNHSSSTQQKQSLHPLKQDKQTMEQENKQFIKEMEHLRASYTNLEQLLKSKDDTIVSLNRENHLLSEINQGNQYGTNEMVETLKNLLQSKDNEIVLLKQNTEQLLAKERRRNDTLEKENRVLKQERIQQQTAVKGTDILNNSISPKNVGANHHDHCDDPYNDINYDTEDDKTEESDSDDDTSYDTPSEDRDG